MWAAPLQLGSLLPLQGCASRRQSWLTSWHLGTSKDFWDVRRCKKADEMLNRYWNSAYWYVELVRKSRQIPPKLTTMRMGKLMMCNGQLNSDNNLWWSQLLSGWWIDDPTTLLKHLQPQASVVAHPGQILQPHSLLSLRQRECRKCAQGWTSVDKGGKAPCQQTILEIKWI